MNDRPRRRLTQHDLRLKVQRAGLAALLENRAFVQFLWTLFVEAGMFAPTYQRGDPHGTSHSEGRRALGLEVLHMLKAVRPDILSLVEREGTLLDKQVQQETPGEDDEPPNDDP